MSASGTKRTFRMSFTAGVSVHACVTERSALNSKVRAFIEYLKGAI